MKKIALLIGFLSMFFVFSISSAGVYKDKVYSAPILSNEINFEAEYDKEKHKVKMSWESLNLDNFKYYKVVRSQKVSNPIYPDNGYIKYDSNQDRTEYIDYKLKSGTNYYRVCVITTDLDRYCSNVVKLYIDTDDNVSICTTQYAPVCGKKGEKIRTYSNKCMLKSAGAYYKYAGECRDIKISPKGTVTSTGVKSKLDYKIKKRLDILVNKLIHKIDSKDITDESKANLLKGLVLKLESLISKKPVLKDIIEYINIELTAKIEAYNSNLSEIEKIFNEY